ncbi:MAG: FUSC family protein [Candidatus Igneacidithiobacillus chanchocoensis]
MNQLNIADSLVSGSSQWKDLINDLGPFDGRAALAWRIALLCAITTAVGMMYQIPLISLSGYLIVYFMKRDAVVNIITGISLLAFLPFLIGLLVLVINLTGKSTIYLMIAMIASSYFFLYIGAATKIGRKSGIIAFIVVFILSLTVKSPFGDATTFALRQVWAVAGLPMIFLIVFNLFFGFSPVMLLRTTVINRLKVAESSTENNELSILNEMIGGGNSRVVSQAGLIRLLRLVPSSSARQILADARASYLLMLSVATLPLSLDVQRRSLLSDQIRAAHSALTVGENPPLPDPSLIATATSDAEKQAWYALGILGGNPETKNVAAPKSPFLAHDAFTNPAYSRHALKTTLAAMICFFIYTSIDWQGIHTAMVTCYVAALSTTGDTVHKLVLRISGSLVGAVLGMASILFIIPHLHGIEELMVLIFFGTFIGAWVTTGPARISYAGVQITIAFLLTVLQGFDTGDHLGTGWDRIVGILLGNIIVYLVFTRIWPVPVDVDVRAKISQALSHIAHLARLTPPDRSYAVDSVSTVEALTYKGEQALRLARYEPSMLRLDASKGTKLYHALTGTKLLNREVWLSRDEDLGSTAALIDELVPHFQSVGTLWNDRSPTLESTAPPEKVGGYLQLISEAAQR